MDRHRSRFGSCLTVLALVTGIAAATGAQRFDDCASLLKKFPDGVARSRLAAAGTGAHVDAAIYTANSNRLDRDKDGVMCEQRGSPSPARPGRGGTDQQRRKAAQSRLGS